MVGAGNFNEFMRKAMEDPHYKKKKVDEANPYASGTSKKAQTKAKALLQQEAFKGVSDPKMAFAYLARAFDKLMKESLDLNEKRGVTATIKFSRSQQREIEKVLDAEDVDYSYVQDGEIAAEFKSRGEAEDVMDKLPPIRYRID